MEAGIKEILIITTEYDQEAFIRLLGDGKQWGIKISFAVQKNPDGLAQSFIIASEFINNNPSCLILGDNLFYGFDQNNQLQEASKKTDGGTIFAYRVRDPERYGVVEFDNNKNVISIEEKPQKPKSRYAVTGLYFFDKKVVEYSKQLKPSSRKELEIVDLLKIYLRKKKLTSEILGRGSAWLDSGSIEDFYKTSAFVSAIENRQGFKIGCPEEIAFNNKWIGKKEILNAIQFYGNCDYANYLKKLI